MEYLLDTNVLSEAIKSTPNPALMAMVEKNRDRLATAAPVWHELWFGSFRLPPSRKREKIQDYLISLAHSSLQILPYDTRAALYHAKERARLAKMGRTPAFVDGQIAAIASVKRLVLVSRNIKDMEHFSGITLENWFME